MDVFLIPTGPDRYELYCESAAEQEPDVESLPRTGLLGRLRQRFTYMLRAAEDRYRRDAPADEPRTWFGRVQDRTLGWVAQRIVEQRLLWNLRRQTAAVVVHAPELAFAEVLPIVRTALQRDYDRHRVWLVIDTLGLVVSTPIALVPGPNLLAYYFAFRVVGHWLSMRGAAQGLWRVQWSGRPCPPLTELRDVVLLGFEARDARVHDIASRLRLPHLSTFLQRMTVRHA